MHDNEYVSTDEDRQLFERIRQHVYQNPDRFQSVGREIEGKCDAASAGDVGVDPGVWGDQLDDHQRRVIALKAMVRHAERGTALADLPQQKRTETADRLLLFAWLISDPDAGDKSAPPITVFQGMGWSPSNETINFDAEAMYPAQSVESIERYKLRRITLGRDGRWLDRVREALGLREAQCRPADDGGDQRMLAEDGLHSEDFTSVDWFGTRHTFSKGNQAEAVRVLWEAWKQGGHSLSQETIGERIKSSADRFELRKTFRQRKAKGDGYGLHPAWGTMIQQDGKGCFRLVRPKSD